MRKGNQVKLTGKYPFCGIIAQAKKDISEETEHR